MSAHETASALLQAARVPLLQQEADLLSFLSSTGWGQDTPPECFKFGPIRMILSSSASNSVYRLSKTYEWNEGSAFVDEAQDQYVTRLLGNGVSAAVISRHLMGMTERSMPLLFDSESGDFLVGEQEVPTYASGVTDESAANIVEDVLEYVNAMVQGLEKGVDGAFHHRARFLANKQAIVDSLNAGGGPGLFYLSTTGEADGYFGVPGSEIATAKQDGRIPHSQPGFSGPGGMTCYGFVRVKVRVRCHAPDSNNSAGTYDVFCFVPRPRRCGLRQIHLTVTTVLSTTMPRPTGQSSDYLGSGLPDGYVGEPLYVVLNSAVMMTSVESPISEDPGLAGSSGSSRASMFQNHGSLTSYGHHTYNANFGKVTWQGWETYELRQNSPPTFTRFSNEIGGGFKIYVKPEIVNLCSRRVVLGFDVSSPGAARGDWVDMSDSDVLESIASLYPSGVSNSGEDATIGEVPGSLVSFGVSESRRSNIVVDNLMFCAVVDRPLLYIGNVWSMNRAIDRVRIKVGASNVEWSAAVRSGDLGDFTEIAVNESVIAEEAEDKWRAMISQLRSQDGWFVGMGSVVPITIGQNRLQETDVFATALEAGVNIETQVMIPKDVDAADSFDITFRSANSRTNKAAEQGPYSSLVFADSMKIEELTTLDSDDFPAIWIDESGTWYVFAGEGGTPDETEMQALEDSLYLLLAHGRLPDVVDYGFGSPDPDWDSVSQDIFGLTYGEITVNPENLSRRKAEASEFTLMQENWQYPVSSELRAGQLLLWGAARMQQFIAVAGSLVTNPTGFGSFQMVRDGIIVYDPNKTMDDYYELTEQDIQDRQDEFDSAHEDDEGGGGDIIIV